MRRRYRVGWRDTAEDSWKPTVSVALIKTLHGDNNKPQIQQIHAVMSLQQTSFPKHPKNHAYQT